MNKSGSMFLDANPELIEKNLRFIKVFDTNTLKVLTNLQVTFF